MMLRCANRNLMAMSLSTPLSSLLSARMLAAQSALASAAEAGSQISRDLRTRILPAPTQQSNSMATPAQTLEARNRSSLPAFDRLMMQEDSTLSGKSMTGRGKAKGSTLGPRMQPYGEAEETPLREREAGARERSGKTDKPKDREDLSMTKMVRDNSGSQLKGGVTDTSSSWTGTEKDSAGVSGGAEGRGLEPTEGDAPKVNKKPVQKGGAGGDASEWVGSKSQTRAAKTSTSSRMNMQAAQDPPSLQEEVSEMEGEGGRVGQCKEGGVKELKNAKGDRTATQTGGDDSLPPKEKALRRMDDETQREMGKGAKPTPGAERGAGPGGAKHGPLTDAALGRRDAPSEAKACGVTEQGRGARSEGDKARPSQKDAIGSRGTHAI